jgi:hypothetical protein
MVSSQKGSEAERDADQNSESYECLARHQIAIVRQDSPDAAAIIETILERGGAQAVLRATFILAVLKLEVLQKHQVPDLKSYAYMVQDYEEIRPLFEQTIEYCLLAWSLQDSEVEMKNANRNDRIAKI